MSSELVGEGLEWKVALKVHFWLLLRLFLLRKKVDRISINIDRPVRSCRTGVFARPASDAVLGLYFGQA